MAGTPTATLTRPIPLWVQVLPCSHQLGARGASGRVGESRKTERDVGDISLILGLGDVSLILVDERRILNTGK